MRVAAAMLAVAACFATAADAQTASPYAAVTIPLRIDQVPGQPIWYSTGNPGVPGKDNEGNTSNAGFVVTSDGVVVFDVLGTPSLGWALLQEIRKVSDKKIRYVVASHYHADHIYGLQAFKDHTDAIVVAQERAGEYKETRRPLTRRPISVSISAAARCFHGWTRTPAWCRLTSPSGIA
jgi:glyoxylase-like metal-dependent hydrolase (beta-lactamase superfamily II)